MFTAGAQSRVIAGIGKIRSIRHEICSLSWCSAKARFLTLVSIEHKNDPVTGYCDNPCFWTGNRKIRGIAGGYCEKHHDSIREGTFLFLVDNAGISLGFLQERYYAIIALSAGVVCGNRYYSLLQPYRISSFQRGVSGVLPIGKDHYREHFRIKMIFTIYVFRSHLLTWMPCKGKIPRK